MATIKSYTDINQSRKLAEILPLESADMFIADVVNYKDKEQVHSYNFHVLTTWGCKTFAEIKEREPYHAKFIPCWSLAALLELLDYPQLSKDKLGSGKVGWMVSVYPNDCRYDSCWYDNLVDACVAMIEKLDELKMF